MSDFLKIFVSGVMQKGNNPPGDENHFRRPHPPCRRQGRPDPNSAGHKRALRIKRNRIFVNRNSGPTQQAFRIFPADI